MDKVRDCVRDWVRVNVKFRDLGTGWVGEVGRSLGLRFPAMMTKGKDGVDVCNRSGPDLPVHHRWYCVSFGGAGMRTMVPSSKYEFGPMPVETHSSISFTISLVTPGLPCLS